MRARVATTHDKNVSDDKNVSRHVDVFSSNLPEFLVKNGLKTGQTASKTDFYTPRKVKKIEKFDFFREERF